MSRVKLTVRLVARLKAPDPSGKQTIHWDDDLKGFGVLCSGVTTVRTYIAQRDLPGTKITRRLTVGAVNEISLEVARERAADMLDALRRGVDPKNRKGIATTLNDILADYLAARKTLRPASARMYRIAVERYLAAWGELPLASITADMCELRHRQIAAEVAKGDNDGTSTANFAMKAFRILHNFAADRIPDLGPNPVRRLRQQWYKEKRRERIVGVNDLPRFYEEVDHLPNPIARDFILLLLFTGLRIGEARALRWSEIDLQQGVIYIPAERTKSGRKLDLPMSDFVRDMLIARRSLGDGGWVFPAPSRSGHLYDTQFHLGLVTKETGIQISAHDLRRTFITVAESCEVHPFALKALVNHSTGKDVTSGYVIYTTERLREVTQKITDRLKELCEIDEPVGTNVSKLRPFGKA